MPELASKNLNTLADGALEKGLTMAASVPIIEEQTQSAGAQARQVARRIRMRALELTLTNKGGYLSQACSAAEILATLYTRVMHLGSSAAPMIPAPFPGVPGPNNPDAFTGALYNGPKASNLDRFFISPVHYA